MINSLFFSTTQLAYHKKYLCRLRKAFFAVKGSITPEYFSHGKEEISFFSDRIHQVFDLEKLELCS
jgi:hypothetical protein